MKNLFWGGLVSLFMVAPLSPSQAEGAVEKSSEKTSYVMCRNKKMVRTIRVSEEPGNCQTVYTKLGKDQIVAQAKNPRSCYTYLANIRGNLEKADWRCKDISSALVTDSEP